MKWLLFVVLTGLAASVTLGGDADGRGFGGFGGFRAGGFEAGGLGGYRGGSFDASGFRAGGTGSFESSANRYGGWGDRGFDYSGSRSLDTYSGWRGAGATSSYDRSYTDARGGSISTEGTRGAAVGPWGGAAVGGTRDTTLTTAGGRTYTADRQAGAAVGPYGRTVGGASGSAFASGPRGTAGDSWQTAFAGTRFPTDAGLAHYSSFSGAAVGHSTAYWSGATMAARGTAVRTNFGYYTSFRPGWYAAHPGAWAAAGWAAGAAWTAASWPTLSFWCGIPAQPVDYDYGNTVVYQDNSVYLNGQDVGTAQTFAQQATAIADAGQKAQAPPDADWKPLGVFALVQGDEKTSNNLFQLAVNKDGIIRGNFYDGLLDTTTPVYGSVDKKSQRAAWTVGKKNDRVFEAGVYNLTQPQTTVLVHIGPDRTQQMMLVRVEQPSASP